LKGDVRDGMRGGGKEGELRDRRRYGMRMGRENLWKGLGR